MLSHCLPLSSPRLCLHALSSRGNEDASSSLRSSSLEKRTNLFASNSANGSLLLNISKIIIRALLNMAFRHTVSISVPAAERRHHSDPIYEDDEEEDDMLLARLGAPSHKGSIPR